MKPRFRHRRHRHQGHRASTRWSRPALEIPTANFQPLISPGELLVVVVEADIKSPTTTGFTRMLVGGPDLTNLKTHRRGLADVAFCPYLEFQGAGARCHGECLDSRQARHPNGKFTRSKIVGSSWTISHKLTTIASLSLGGAESLSWNCQAPSSESCETFAIQSTPSTIPLVAMTATFGGSSNTQSGITAAPVY